VVTTDYTLVLYLCRGEGSTYGNGGKISLLIYVLRTMGTENNGKKSIVLNNGKEQWKKSIVLNNGKEQWKKVHCSEQWERTMEKVHCSEQWERTMEKSPLF
jgi:hypothetical protein